MSETSALESNEELENILFIVNDSEILNICAVNHSNDEDSSIGSMVCVKTENVVDDDIDSPEFNAPEVEPSAARTLPLALNVEKSEVKHNPDSWPTLEILPGGVIKQAEYEGDLASLYQSKETDNEKSDLLYACAKCPKSFKFLFCLAEHVKWHEDQLKEEKAADFDENEIMEKKILCLQKVKKKNNMSKSKYKAEYESDLESIYRSSNRDNEKCGLIYACAKCPQRFKFLFSLVRHVKWHENEKTENTPDLKENELMEKKIACPQEAKKKKVISKLKSKCMVPKKS